MALLFSVSLFLGAYVLLRLADRYIKVKWSAKYRGFLQDTGLDLSIAHCHFSWTTTRLNRLWPAIVHVKPRLWDMWFSAGTWITVSLILPSLFLLANNAWTVIRDYWIPVVSPEDRTPFHQPILQPMIPGINVPVTQLPIVLFALLVCSVIHEAGHAIAAAKEGVPVLGCGILVLVFLPAAFVSLPTVEVTSLPPVKQLRIYAAGIWHNLVLIAVGMALLSVFASTAGLFYSEGLGHVVYHVKEGSSLRGPRGLDVGDVVTHINGCETKSPDTWKSCLEQAHNSSQAYCLSSTALETLGAEEGDLTNPENSTCCPEDDASRVCFSLRETLSSAKFYRCWTARQVIELADYRRCGDANLKCPYCVSPVFKDYEQLFVLQRRWLNSTVAPAVLYIGLANDIWSETHVSPYISKWSLLPVWLPACFGRIIRYLIILSGGLALLNIVPCPGLDGQHMTSAIINVFWPQPSPYKSLVNKAILGVGTVLLCSSLVLGLLQLF